MICLRFVELPTCPSICPYLLVSIMECTWTPQEVRLQRQLRFFAETASGLASWNAEEVEQMLPDNVFGVRLWPRLCKNAAQIIM